ncbi:MAG: phosphoribosylformylglycinamidine cyclo-ligase [Pseudomonadales bacterium]|nr:phosphoribosylformylglycinamidine cyclo-ligase [Pseudomonadales bacterium]
MRGNSATICASQNWSPVISQNLTYKDAGVDIDAGAALIERIGAACKATHRPEMLSTLGGFAAMTEIPTGYDQPVLVSGTDGVGTKLKLAIDHDRHDGVGQDLVAMCVNDVLVTGAEPFLFLDYYATGHLEVDTAARVIKGIAYGCELAGCSLAGGETAEMPGFYEGEEYDLAGFAVGVVNKPNIIDGSQINAGDNIIGLPSSGPHSNGYSLVRKVLENQTTPPNESLLDDLLAPTRIYVKSVLQALRERPGAIHGMVHITGGGFYENIPRIFSDDSLAALIDTDSWAWPEVFSFLQQAGNIEHREMLTTFNCGIGFLMMVDPTHTEALLDVLVTAGEESRVIGQVVDAATEPSASQILVS